MGFFKRGFDSNFSFQTSATTSIVDLSFVNSAVDFLVDFISDFLNQAAQRDKNLHFQMMDMW
ncbi:MAG: hypothetical protein MTP17_03375 [Candidatus Midichloria sp.]|nr:MAG: hypothetical protein MTP17_03375 [Candidatus Midichloria sp.]